MQLLAISGSLRAGSSNSAVLDAARLIAPAGVEVVVFEGLAGLPAFNPDEDTLEGDRLPPAALDLRAMVGRADGVLICSPEYAHGIPGSLKNLLDWLVGSVEFPETPVSLLSTSSRQAHARAQLVEVLTTMNARIIEEASITVALPARTMDARDIAANPEVAATLRGVIEAMARAADSRV